MLLIFGTILAVSVISLVVLLVIRSKKMKAANNKLKNDISQSNANSMMPAVAPEIGSPGMNMAVPGNAMQFTANPFETNNLDLNSQNLGNNLAATSGMPNEGIMQNPVPAPNMQIASAVTPEMSAAPVIPSMAPSTQPMMSVDPVTAAAPQNIAMQNPVINSVPDMTIATAPINPTPVVSEPVQMPAPTNFDMTTATPAPQATMPAVPMEPAMPVAPVSAPVVMAAAPAPVVAQPAVMTSSMNVNAVNGSGMDATAQPLNPLNVGVQDPAGIFTQQTTAPATNTTTPEPTIAELPNVQEAPTEAAITDLTPDQNMVATIPAQAPEMKLPDVSEIDLTAKAEIPAPATPAIPEQVVPEIAAVPTATPIVSEAPAIPAMAPLNQPIMSTTDSVNMPQVSTPSTNGLPPLNNLVNTPNQPIQTPMASTMPTAAQQQVVAAPAMPMMNAATTMAQPIAPVAANLGMQPDPLLNQAPVMMNTGVVTPPQTQA
jgi:hypothetical protein